MNNLKENNLDPGWNFNNSYLKLPNILYSKVNPVPTKDPKLIILNKDLYEDLGLNFDSFSKENIAKLFSGNILPKNSESIAQAYAGHQFGNFAILGDGRATLLGEHTINKNQTKVDIQLKGSGKTPYSRNGDGRATLTSMMREFLFSEAMHGLNIPTTRSLAVVSTGELINREKSHIGGVLTRVAASHLRIGTFQYAALHKNNDLLSRLVDYSLERHYPNAKIEKNKAITLLQSVIEKQLSLTVNWMRVGYIMGVANTDNVTISGESIDFGPCSFMNAYNQSTVFSSIDYQGRYAFGNQPIIAHWNLSRFAETLIPLIDSDYNNSIKIGEEIINNFSEKYKYKWLEMMKSKLGFYGFDNGDEKFILKILRWMTDNNADYTNTFCFLMNDLNIKDPLYKKNSFELIHDEWKKRIQKNTINIEMTNILMMTNNPKVIPRNYIVEEALDDISINNNFLKFNNLLDVVKNPYHLNNKIKNSQVPPNFLYDKVYKTYCGT